MRNVVVRLRQLLLSSTSLWALSLFAAVLATGEWLLRMPSVQRELPSQAITLDNPPFNTTFTLLDLYSREHPDLNCIFLGNSMVANGIDVEAFQAAYASVSDQPLTCVNFGLPGLPSSGAGAVARALVEQYHPRLLIYGTSANEYAFVGAAEMAGLRDNPWISYRTGDFTAQGWLITQSYGFRYLRSLRLQFVAWREKSSLAENTGNLRPIRGAESGYTPLVYYRDKAPRFWEPPPTQSEVPAPPEDNIEGLRQLMDLAQQGVSVVIVEMPEHPKWRTWIFGSLESYAQYLSDAVKQARGARQVPFWSTGHLVFTDEDYFDGVHFYISGSYKFSRWLGRQIGEAVELGLLDGMLPEAALTSPPLPNLPLEAVDPPLSAEVWQSYQQHAAQFTTLPPEALVFNPAQGALADPAALLRLLLLLEYAADLTLTNPLSQEVAQMLDLASVLGHTRYESDLTAEQQVGVERWRQSKAPADLLEVGIAYLVYTDRWRGYLSEQEYAILTDTARYEPLGQWYHEVNRETYFLYHLKED